MIVIVSTHSFKLPSLTLSLCHKAALLKNDKITNDTKSNLTSSMSGYCLFRFPAAEITDFTALIPKS